MPAHQRETAPDGSSEPEADAKRGGIGRWKRAGAAVLGGTLVAVGVGRRSLGGAALALAGGWLSYRAVSGRGLGPRTQSNATTGREEDADPLTVERSVTVGRPPDDLSEFLRDPETLGRVVNGLAEVTAEGEDRHRWVVHGPLGRSLSWETRVVDDSLDERLRWEPVEGASPAEGSVEFRPAPDGRGTEVTLRVRVDPPGGRVGTAATERLGVVPEALLGVALDRLKSLAETGEIPTIEENPSARGRGDLA